MDKIGMVLFAVESMVAGILLAPHGDWSDILVDIFWWLWR